jgi:hypothetical protein
VEHGTRKMLSAVRATAIAHGLLVTIQREDLLDGQQT